jgi:DNA-binding response OmpR family regulator
MDVQMPLLDGCEATRFLRQRGYEQPIIALTAHALDDDRRRCLEAGCTAFASKPVQRESLLRLIASLLPPAAPAETTHVCPVPSSGAGAHPPSGAPAPPSGLEGAATLGAVHLMPAPAAPAEPTP